MAPLMRDTMAPRNSLCNFKIGPAVRYTLSILVVFTTTGCSESTLSHEDLAHACVRTTACSFQPYPRVANCMGAYFTQHARFGLGPVYDSIYECVNAAGDCGALYACFGTDQATASCDRNFSGRCDGDRAVSCDLISDQQYTYDCAAAGLTCAMPTDQTFSAKCTTGTCGADFPRQCDGDRLLTCHNSVVEVVDCAASGLVCSESKGCAGAGDPCITQTASCDGDVAVSCVGGHTHREDCTVRAQDRSCANGRCVPTHTECLDEFDRCDGSDLQSCIDGQWVTFDCTELGLNPCVPSSTGAACVGK